MRRRPALPLLRRRLLALLFGFAAVVFTVTVVGAGTLGSATGTHAALVAAVELINAERFRDAAATVERVLQAEPENADALHLLAVALLKGGSSDADKVAGLARAAITAASKITRRGGRVATAQYYNTLGLALMEKGGAYGEALAAFDKSLEVSAGGYTSALYNKGSCLMSAEQYQRAATHWKRMLDKDPSDAKARLELAATLREAPMRDYAGSRAILERLAQESPGNAEVVFQLGVTVHVGGRPSEAIKLYERVLELHVGPKPSTIRWSAQLNMAAVLQERGEFARALKTLERLIEEKEEEGKLSRSDSGAFNNAGACHWQLEQTAQAFQMYTKSLQLNPESKEALINLGIYYYELGDLEDAEASYDKAIQIEQAQLANGVVPTRPVSGGLKVRKALLMRPIMTSVAGIAESRVRFARAIDELSRDPELVLHSPVRDIERTHFYLMCRFWVGGGEGGGGTRRRGRRRGTTLTQSNTT